MNKKKSYMDKNSILVEGFFDTLAKFFKDKSKIKALKKDKKFMGHIDKMNSSLTNIEKYFKDQDIDITLQKFNAKDFKK